MIEKTLNWIFRREKRSTYKIKFGIKGRNSKLRAKFLRKKKDILESKLNIQRNELEELNKNISFLSTENLTVKKEINCFIDDTIDFLSSRLNSLEEQISPNERRDNLFKRKYSFKY